MTYPADAAVDAALDLIDDITEEYFLDPLNAHVERFPEALRAVGVIAEYARDAALAAAGSASNAASLVGTSTTTRTPATGSLAFTTQSGRAWTTGTWLIVSSAADPANYAHGYVDSYSGTALVLECTGTGETPASAADWNIALSGPQGEMGNDGPTGADGHGGDKFQFNTATSGDPGSGKFRTNHATFMSATVFAVSETDGYGNNIASYLAAIDNGSGTHRLLGVLIEHDGSSRLVFWLNSALTDAGSYDTFTMEPIAGTTPSNNDTFYLLLVPIEKGDAGDTGWSPELALETDGSRRVLKIVDWQGGSGSEPAVDKYIGATGLEDVIGDGVDVRGPAGSPGAGSGDYVSESSVTADHVPIFGTDPETQLKDSGETIATLTRAASLTQSGRVEIATAAETTTGTDADRAVSPDGLAGSVFGEKVAQVLVSDPNGSAITTGDSKAFIRIPSSCNGMNLVAVAASVDTVSSSGIPTVQLRRKRSGSDADMLSTKLTIDASETDSSSAATAAVINTGNDDVATGDRIYIDIDVAGTGAKGLLVEMIFRLP